LQTGHYETSFDIEFGRWIAGQALEKDVTQSLPATIADQIPALAL